MFCLPGWGAEDAWYETAVRIEPARTTNQVLSGAIDDIFKCFDQISRVLLAILLFLGGMPHGILFAYLRFQDQVNVYNCVAGGVGQPYHRRCSIPQGCPFSMMLIQFMLRILSQLIKSLHPGVLLRMLADDLLLLYLGEQLNLLVDAFGCMHSFLFDLGSRLAPSKSATFSTDSNFRDYLRSHVWEQPGQTIGVRNHFRDLGTHVNIAGRTVAPTITGRLKRSVGFVHKVSRLPHSTLNKATFINGKALAMGLYGCEAAPCSDGPMAALTAAIASAIGPHSKRSGNALVFSLLPDAKDCDPEWNVLNRRCKLLRRSTVKMPHLVPFC